MSDRDVRVIRSIVTDSDSDDDDSSPATASSSYHTSQLQDEFDSDYEDDSWDDEEEEEEGDEMIGASLKSRVQRSKRVKALRAKLKKRKEARKAKKAAKSSKKDGGSKPAKPKKKSLKQRVTARFSRGRKDKGASGEAGGKNGKKPGKPEKDAKDKKEGDEDGGKKKVSQKNEKDANKKKSQGGDKEGADKGNEKKQEQGKKDGEEEKKKEDGKEKEKEKKEKGDGKSASSSLLEGGSSGGGGGGDSSGASSLGGGDGGGAGGGDAGGGGGGLGGGLGGLDEDVGVADSTVTPDELASTAASSPAEKQPKGEVVGRRQKKEKARRKAEKARRKAEKKAAKNLADTQRRLAAIEQENENLRRQRESTLATYADNPAAANVQLAALDSQLTSNQEQAAELEDQTSEILRNEPELEDEAAKTLLDEAANDVDNKGRPDSEVFDGSFKRTLRELGTYPEPAPFPAIDGAPEDLGKGVILENEEALDALDDYNEADELEGEAVDSDEEKDNSVPQEDVVPFKGGKRHALQQKKTRNWFQDALNGRKGTLTKARDFFSGFSWSAAAKGGTFPVVSKDDLQWLRASPDDRFFGMVRPTASTPASDLVIMPDFAAESIGKRVELSTFGGGNPIVNPDLWEPLLQARDRWRAAILSNEALPRSVRLFIAERYAVRTSLYAPIFGWTEGAIERNLVKIYSRGITRVPFLFVTYSRSGQYTFGACRRLSRVADVMRAIQLDVAKLRLFMIVTRQSKDPQFVELLLDALRTYIAIHLWFGIRDSYMVILSTQLTGSPWFDRKVMPGLDLLRWCRFPNEAPLNRLIADGRIGPQDLFVPAEPNDPVFSFFARPALAAAAGRPQRLGDDLDVVVSQMESTQAVVYSDGRVPPDVAQELSRMAIYKAKVETEGMRMPAHAGTGVKSDDTLLTLANAFGSSFAQMALYHKKHPDLPLEKTPYSPVLRYVVPIRYWFLLSHSERVTDMQAKLIFLRVAGITRSLTTKGEASVSKWADLAMLLGIADPEVPKVVASTFSVQNFLADPRSETEPQYIMISLRKAVIPADKKLIEEAVPAPGWTPPTLHLMQKGLGAVAARMDELLVDPLEEADISKAELLGTFVVLSQKAVRGRFAFDDSAQKFMRASVQWASAFATWALSMRAKSVEQASYLKILLSKTSEFGLWFKEAEGPRAQALWLGYVKTAIDNGRVGRGSSDYDDLRALGTMLDKTSKTVSYTNPQKFHQMVASSAPNMAAYITLSKMNHPIDEPIPIQIRDIETLALLQSLMGANFWSPKPSTPNQEAYAWAQLSRQIIVDEGGVSHQTERRVYRRVHKIITKCLGPSRSPAVIRFFTQNEAQEMNWAAFLVWWVYHNVSNDTLLRLDKANAIVGTSDSSIVNACEAICSLEGKHAEALWESVERAISNVDGKRLASPDPMDANIFYKMDQHNVVNGYYALLLLPLYGNGFSFGAQETDWFSLQALTGSPDPEIAAREHGSGILKTIHETLGGASQIYYAFAEQLLIARVCLARWLWSAADKNNQDKLWERHNKAAAYLGKAIQAVRRADNKTATVLSALYDACLSETSAEDCFALFKTAFA